MIATTLSMPEGSANRTAGSHAWLRGATPRQRHAACATSMGQKGRAGKSTARATHNESVVTAGSTESKSSATCPAAAPLRGTAGPCAQSMVPTGFTARMQAAGTGGESTTMMMIMISGTITRGGGESTTITILASSA